MTTQTGTMGSMWRKFSSPQALLWGSLIVVLVAVAGAGTWQLVGRRAVPRLPATEGLPRLPAYGAVPAFSLTERSGRPISREDLLGKVWIANFIFTSCTATCPTQSATLSKFQTQLPQPDLRFVSITIDPDHDTPEVLSRYAERFRADPARWLFLTGEEQAIFSLAQEGFHLSAFAVPAADATPIERAFRGSDGASDAFVHDPRFALVDRRGRIRGYYSSLDPEAIARLLPDVKALLAERP
jgi:protein SCO1/2